MATTTTMPDPATDLVGCLTALAAEHGDEWVFQLVRGVRTHTRAAADPVGAYQVELARAMVADEMHRTNADQKTAIKEVGIRLGYQPFKRQEGGPTINTLVNFDKLVKGLTRDMKPIEGRNR